MEIKITGDIGSEVTYEDILSQIDQAVGPIRVVINSTGGHISHGLGIYNALRRSGHHIHTIVDGVAASMASVIAMAGDEIEIPEHGLMMIHEAWFPNASGNSDALREHAARLDEWNDALVNIYSKRSGQPEDAVRQWLKDETWLMGKEALELGFATKVTGSEVVMLNSFDFSKFNNPPDLRSLMAKTEDDAQEYNLLDDAGNVIPEEWLLDDGSYLQGPNGEALDPSEYEYDPEPGDPTDVDEPAGDATGDEPGEPAESTDEAPAEQSTEAPAAPPEPAPVDTPAGDPVNQVDMALLDCYSAQFGVEEAVNLIKAGKTFEEGLVAQNKAQADLIESLQSQLADSKKALAAVDLGEDDPVQKPAKPVGGAFQNVGVSK